VIERQRPEDEPLEGLMLDVAHAHDDHFRWRVAAAAVEHAKNIDATEYRGDVSAAIWRWTEVGEVVSRSLAVALKMDPLASDDDIREAVQENWSLIMAGMPPQGVPNAEP
jgi:hypothetical protein